MSTASPFLRSKALHHKIGDSGCKHQETDQPSDKSLPRRFEHLVHLFLEGWLGGDISIHYILGLFQTDIPLLTNNLDRLDHIALPQRLNSCFGKV